MKKWTIQRNWQHRVHTMKTKTIEEGQVIQWSIEKEQMDKQWSTQKTKHWGGRTSLKIGDELVCSIRVSSSCSTSDIRGVPAHFLCCFSICVLLCKNKVQLFEIFLLKKIKISRISNSKCYFWIIFIYVDFQRHRSWPCLCSVSSDKMRGECSLCWYWMELMTITV